MNNIESNLITQNSQWWSNGELESKPLIDIKKLVERSKPIKIIGPCAAQSTDQLTSILDVVGHQADFVRAPLKKPRTRPVNSLGERLFEGVGIQEGRVMLINVEETHKNIRWAMETMDGEDINLLQDIVSLPWVGSRNQDAQNCRNIGHAAALAKLPVMVKNPLTGNIEDWLGMMENVICGSKNQVPVMACVRGRQTFTTTEERQWRNTPNLELITLIKKSFPDLPVVVDPSHMLHKHDPKPLQTIENIILNALDLGASGIMVEVFHPEHLSITDPGIDANSFINLIEKRSW